MPTPEQVNVTRFRVIANHLQFLHAEVWIDNRPGMVLADFEKGTIRVSWQGGSLNLTMDDYDQYEGDLCSFLSEQITELYAERNTSQ